MTAYLAGIAQTRCEDQPKADQIDGVARAVLAAMAFVVGESDPRCYASQTRIATKAGFDRMTVNRALNRLAELDLIERVESRSGVPVHWRLKILSGPGPDAESIRSTDGNLMRRASGGDAESIRGCDSEHHNPSDSSRPQGREERGRSAAASAPASADATAVAAAASTENTLVAEVQEALGCSPGHAEQYIERKIDRASERVRNRTPFIRRCLESDQAAASTSPKRGPKGTGKGAAKGAKGPGKGHPGSGKRRKTTREERAEAVAALRDGRESIADVAARLGSAPATVKEWWSGADRADALHAVRNGGDVADVLTRYPRCPRHMEPTLRHVARPAS